MSITFTCACGAKVEGVKKPRDVRTILGHDPARCAERQNTAEVEAAKINERTERMKWEYMATSPFRNWAAHGQFPSATAEELGI